MIEEFQAAGAIAITWAAGWAIFAAAARWRHWCKKKGPRDAGPFSEDPGEQLAQPVQDPTQQ